MAAVAFSLAVRPSAGQRTWTVIDENYRTVAPVEDWLEANRHLWSPNTVRGYATSLAQWWTFLEQRGETARWGDVGVPAVAGFLSWLRNGRTVERALVEREEAPAPETLEARLAALISFYRWQEAALSVPVAGRLLRGAPRRVLARGLLAHLDARDMPGPSSLVRVRRHRHRGRPPLLLPAEIQAILDGCARPDAALGEWTGNLRDRLLFALLAETGVFSGDRPCGGGLTPRVCAAQRLMIRGYRAQQVWCKWVGGGSPVAVSGVEAGHQFAVGGAGGGEVLVAFGEFQAQVDGLLFEVGDLLVQGVDVGRGAQPGLAPGVLTECFGEALLEVLDASVQPGGAFVGGEQVGLQRGSGDRRAGVFAGGWFGGQGVDLLEQVAVAVEEAAVHRGGAGDRGHPDLGACSDGIVERGDNALAAAEGVGTAPVGHRLGPCARRRGGARRPHAVASEVVVVRGAGPAPRTVGMPSGTAWAAR